MADLPSQPMLVRALAAAASAHDEYERTVLKGVVDANWSGFYAAYVLGRLGDFVPAGRLASLLSEVEDDADWDETAADHVLVKLRS
jgi:hypothetical protein